MPKSFMYQGPAPLTNKKGTIMSALSRSKSISTTLDHDIEELILSRLTAKQLDRWNSSNVFYEDLLPKITKAKWAIDALKEIDRRCEERTEARYEFEDAKRQAMYQFIKDNCLKGWKTYQGKAYYVVSKKLQPGTLHSYEIELCGNGAWLTTTDGWSVDVLGYRTAEEIQELSQLLNK
jgi:hypothetical protein